jgi:hypothetical protein
MNAFFQDLSHDLRAKRLWPVAVAMLIGIVAIPAVLTKSAASPPPPEAAVPTSDAKRDSSLALDVDTPATSGKGSSLDVFAADDPFVPPKAVTGAGASAATTDVAVAGGGDASPGGSAPSKGSPDEAPGGFSPPSAPAPVAPPTTTEYQYVADITFWNGDRRRRIEGLRKLDMLPNESAPVLIFMGATGDGGNAVFLVDSTLTTTGEGDCQPSPSNCAFVHIGPGSEHVFSAETGDTYRIRIDEIRRVKVKAAAAARPSARTAVGGEAAARRFSLPSLVDLVAVTGAEETRSSIPAGGR